MRQKVGLRLIRCVDSLPSNMALIRMMGFGLPTIIIIAGVRTSGNSTPIAPVSSIPISRKYSSAAVSVTASAHSSSFRVQINSRNGLNRQPYVRVVLLLETPKIDWFAGLIADNSHLN